MAGKVRVTGYSEVGLPLPVEINTAELKAALVDDPNVLVDTLRDLLDPQRFIGRAASQTATFISLLTPIIQRYPAADHDRHAVLI